MGTPDFAIPSLEKLYTQKTNHDTSFDIKLVVTRPDKPKGRGLKPQPTPVKLLAKKLGLNIFQPSSIKHPDSIRTITSLNADVAVVVAYGQIIPTELLHSFPMGVINLHPSLLPKYRGAAPIQRAILNGEEQTGITTMLLDEGLDSGPILLQEKVPIELCENAGSLHDKLSGVGAELLAKTLLLLGSSKLTPAPQDHASATYADPIKKEELLISWTQPAELIIRQIRAFDPLPGAYTFWKGKRLKCYGACYSKWVVPSGKAGEVIGMEDNKVVIKASDNKGVTISHLQLEGRKKLSAEEFVRGTKNFIGSVLG